MIPKIIHYCWLSDDPMPKDFLEYIGTWKNHLKDYEFIKWDFNKFPKDRCPWVSEAFDCKKYAFAADYLRLYALYHYGGIYLDCDVEVLKPFDQFLELNTMMCYENTDEGKNGEIFLEVAAFGSAKGEKWVGDCLKHYDDRHFINEAGEMDMKTLPEIVMDGLVNNGYVIKDVYNVQDAKLVKEKEIPVFPYDYFSPKNLFTMEVTVTDNTCSIHNYKGSWSPRPFLHFLLKMGIKYKYANKINEQTMKAFGYVLLPRRVVKSIFEGTFCEKVKKFLSRRNISHDEKKR